EEMLRASSEKFANLAARLDMVREEERGRLAHEIHDELGQGLTILKMDLSSMQKTTAKSVSLRTKLQDIAAQIDNIVDSAHRISGNLRPAVLDNRGLIAAIEWQAQQVQQHTGLLVKVKSTSNKEPIPPQHSIAAFRVVQ